MGWHDIHALLPMNDRRNIDLLLQYFMACGHVMMASHHPGQPTAEETQRVAR